VSAAIASTLKGQRGDGGGGIGPEETLVADTAFALKPPSKENKWKGDGTDNLVAGPLGGGDRHRRGYPDAPDRMTFIAAREDDVNLVTDELATVEKKSRIQADHETYVAFGLRRDPGGTGQAHNTNYVAAGLAENQRGEVLETDYAHQLTAGGGKPGQGYGAARTQQGVRRLTPVECERLQGLPDGWTNIGDTPDSRRYAALGDAVTANVTEWIGRRLYAAIKEEQ